MTDTDALASKLVTLAVLKKMVAALDADVRESTQMAMTPGDRKAALAGTARIGFVTLTAPEPAWRVTDGEAWRTWVKAHRPDEIVTTEAVRSSFEKAMLERGCDENGEALPGVSLVAGVSVVQVRPTPDAEAKIRTAIEAEGLSFAQVLDSFTPRAVES